MSELHEDSSMVVETPFIRTRQLHPEGISQIWHDALVSYPKYHVLAISKTNCRTHADITKLHCHGLPHPSLRQCRVSHSIHCLKAPASIMHQLGNASVRKYEEFFDNGSAPPWLRLCLPHSPAPYTSGMENLLPHSISPSTPRFVSLNGHD